MGIESNKPIFKVPSQANLHTQKTKSAQYKTSVSTRGIVAQNKASRYNNMGLSTMVKATNKSTGHLNKVSTPKFKGKGKSSTQDLFKF